MPGFWECGMCKVKAVVKALYPSSRYCIQVLLLTKKENTLQVSAICQRGVGGGVQSLRKLFF